MANHTRMQVPIRGMFWRIAMWVSLALLAVLLGGFGRLLYVCVIQFIRAVVSLLT